MGSTILFGLSVGIIRYVSLQFILKIGIVLVGRCVVGEHLRVIPSGDDAGMLFLAPAVGEGEGGDGEPVIVGHVLTYNKYN